MSGSETGGAEAKGQMIEGFTSQGKIEIDFSVFTKQRDEPSTQRCLCSQGICQLGGN